MCPRGQGIHSERPLGTLGPVATATQFVEHPLPRTIHRPAPVSHVDGLPLAELGLQVAPRRAGPRPPQDAVDHLPVVQPLSAAPRHRTVRQQRPAPSPLSTQFIFIIAHTGNLPY